MNAVVPYLAVPGNHDYAGQDHVEEWTARLEGIGVRVNGSSRWLQFGPLTVQPSELAKIALVLYTAGYLTRHRERLTRFSSGILVVGLVVGSSFWSLPESEGHDPRRRLSEVLQSSNICWTKLIRSPAWSSVPSP